MITYVYWAFRVRRRDRDDLVFRGAARPVEGRVDRRGRDPVHRLGGLFLLFPATVRQALGRRHEYLGA